MSKLATIARRTFLIGSAAVVGGVASGVHKYKQPAPNPLLGDLPEGATALTPYVRIDAQGVTLITPRAEMRLGAPALGPDKLIIEGAYDQPYGIANYRATAYRTPAGRPVSYWRSVGNSYNGFFIESFIDVARVP